MCLSNAFAICLIVLLFSAFDLASRSYMYGFVHACTACMRCVNFPGTAYVWNRTYYHFTICTAQLVILQMVELLDVRNIIVDVHYHLFYTFN
jgi:hypothetical protein